MDNASAEQSGHWGISMPGPGPSCVSRSTETRTAPSAG